MNMQNIDVKLLYPHPDNPRKNIGDVSELAESVKKNGIMQNLTVVPGHYLTMEEFKAQVSSVGGNKRDAELAYENNRELGFVGDGYTVVIGHRRLAAAKAAGLLEVPCVVSDMDERQQLCTMMEENMQRQDLTIPEQAYGFQFMLDLGEDIKSIAKRTGFGETTIRHRLEIAKLDRKTLEDNLKGSGGYQLGINDLIELEKVKDVKKRNELVKNAYSHADLIGKINAAVIKEKEDTAMEKLLPLLEHAGFTRRPKTVFDWTPGLIKLQQIDLKKKLPETISVEEQPEGTKLYWSIGYDSMLNLWKKEKEDKQKDSEEAQKRKEEADQIKRLKALITEEINNIRTFINLIDEGKARSLKSEEETVCKLWCAVMECGLSFDGDNIFTARGTTHYTLNDEEAEEILHGFLQRKLSTQMAVLLGQKAESYKLETVGYGGEYRKKEGSRLRRIIDVLGDLYGFLPHNDLEQIADGTHELYRKGAER